MRCFGQFSDDRICELCGLCNIDEYEACRDKYDESVKKAKESTMRIINSVTIPDTTDIGGGRISSDSRIWWDITSRPEDDRSDR